jgi:hypothetical protein
LEVFYFIIVVSLVAFPVGMCEHATLFSNCILIFENITKLKSPKYGYIVSKQSVQVCVCYKAAITDLVMVQNFDIISVNWIEVVQVRA